MSPTPENPVRILVVDDSAVIRGFVSRAPKLRELGAAVRYP